MHSNNDLASHNIYMQQFIYYRDIQSDVPINIISNSRMSIDINSIIQYCTSSGGTYALHCMHYCANLRM